MPKELRTQHKVIKMDKKLMGTAAVIGVVAGYMYSKDVFNAAKPYSSRKADEKHCKKLKKYITIGDV